MFWNKKKKEIDKLILNNTADKAQSNDPSTINVKVESSEQIFSTYSYSSDKLNSELGEYIFDKAKEVPITESVKIKIHTTADIEQSDVHQAIKNHCHSIYKESKKQVKRLSFIALIMTILGIIALSALILINHFTDNLYVTSIVEIAAWVFIWEAVDIYFLQRPAVKAKCLLIQRVYMADIEICNVSIHNKLN